MEGGGRKRGVEKGGVNGEGAERNRWAVDWERKV